MEEIVTRDFNGDGLPDIATNGKGTDTINVQFNVGNGDFGPVAGYPVGQLMTDPAGLPLGVEPLSIASGDFNSDGWPDLVSANSTADSLSVILNSGIGTFGGSVEYAIRPDGIKPGAGSVGALYEPNDVKVGDVNNDGIDDLVVINMRGNNLSVLLGQGSPAAPGVPAVGSGAFGPATFYATGGQPTALTLEDLNSDGQIDLVVANKSPVAVPLFPGSPIIRARYQVSVLMNTGLGTFAPQQKYFVGNNPLDVITATLDGNSCPDIVTANHSSTRTVSILYNGCDGTGSFANEVSVPVSTHAQNIKAADLDGDGDNDFVVASDFTPGALLVMINTPDSLTGVASFSLANQTQLVLGSLFNSAAEVDVADYDGDGDLDVILASSLSDNFSLHLSQKIPNVVTNPPVVTGPPDLSLVINKKEAKEKKGVTKVQIGFTVKNEGPGFASGIILAKVTLFGDPTDYFVFVSTQGLAPGLSQSSKFRKELSGDYSGRSFSVEVFPAREITPGGDIIETILGNNTSHGVLP